MSCSLAAMQQIFAAGATMGGALFFVFGWFIGKIREEKPRETLD